jgi:hypothetical protein
MIQFDIMKAVYIHNYKGRAFKLLISSDNPITDDLDTFIWSSIIPEKSLFKNCRDGYISLPAKFGREQELKDVIYTDTKTYLDGSDVSEYLAAGGEKYGIYIPPITLLAMNDDKTAKETYVVDNDSTTASVPVCPHPAVLFCSPRTIHLC